MTDTEKLDTIRAEIHRLVDVRGYDRGMANDLFAFIDSLPNEPASEDLKKATVEWFNSVKYKSDLSGTPINAFKAGAEWQKEQLMKDAVEIEYGWIKPIIYSYIDKTFDIGNDDKVKLIIIKED